MSTVRPTKDELIDLWWHSFWTFVAAFGGINLGVSMLDLDVSMVEALALSGLSQAVGVVTVYARQKAGTLPATRP